MKKYSRDNTALIHCALLAGLWVALAVSANPTGEFPLNDDWAFSHSVFSLFEKGVIEFSDWPVMTLIAHVFWGALFALPFGPTFFILRLSVMVMGLAGCIATYFLLREIKASPSLAFIGTIIIAVNPLYFVLSLSFMTDVPFYTFSMLSILFLLRGVRRENLTDIVIGSIFAVIANYVRQLAIIIPLSLTAALAVRVICGKIPLRRAVIPALIPLTSVIASLAAYKLWLQPAFDLPDLFESETSLSESAGLSLAVSSLVRNGFYTIVYLGLFLLPVLAVLFRERWKSSSSREKLISGAAAAGFAAAISAAFLVQGKLMPLMRNYIYDFGLGPPLLKDVYILELPHLPQAHPIVWLLVTIGCALGGGILLFYLLTACWRLIPGRGKAEAIAGDWTIVFVLSTAALYFLPFGVKVFYYDRYIFYLLPLLLIPVVKLSPPVHFNWKNSTFAGVIIIIICAFSVAGSHDYFSWNRARWKALDKLTEEAGLSWEKIDGGFEFNGMHHFSQDDDRIPGKSWWWVVDDEYILSFGQIPGYEEIGRWGYSRWMFSGEGAVLTLHRKALQTNDSESME